jgi:NAD(P)-dependent dehydrogenase (short-subunit alcohol dehydrogenase family)
MDIQGKVALVTGAGRRLGRAMAQGLAERGMTVALHYHESGDGAGRLAEQIERDGGRAACFQADLTDARAAEDLPRQVVAAMGRLDVLVNSAAVMHRLTLEETGPEQWDAIFALNLRAVFFCTRGAASALRRARGKVVNLADLAGLEPWPGFAAHSISKAGVVMLTKVLARSLAPEVTVNAIAPGAVLVPEDYTGEEREQLARSTPLRRLGSPSDVIAALLYLLEGGDYVTGDILVVDGGRYVK